MHFATIKKLLQCCNANCACTNSCNTNSTNIVSTVSNITVNVYYSISTVRIITSSFKFGWSKIFISLCTKSAVLFAWNKHIKCVAISYSWLTHYCQIWHNWRDRFLGFSIFVAESITIFFLILPETNALQSVIHDNYIIADRYIINGTDFCFVLSFWVNLLLYFPQSLQSKQKTLHSYASSDSH